MMRPAIARAKNFYSSYETNFLRIAARKANFSCNEALVLRGSAVSKITNQQR